MSTERRWVRRLAPAVSLVLVAGLGAGCADDDDDDVAAPASTAASAASATPTAGGPWTFDGGGEAVTLDKRPERVVMFEDVAASLLDLGVRPTGIHLINGIGGNRLFDGYDLAGIATVGEACEQIDVEEVAAAKPDLLVYMTYGGAPFCLTEDQVGQVAKVAPILGIPAEASADDLRATYLDLAEELGADLDSAEITAKRERFEAAVARLEAAVKARPEISVIPVSIAPDFAGVAEPADFADLREMRDRYGVKFAGPKATVAEPSGTYWQEFSAETVTDYRGDVIFIDSKNETPMSDKREAYPLWARLPEVEANQIVAWFVPGSFSYTRDALAMETLAAAIEGAKDFVDEST